MAHTATPSRLTWSDHKPSTRRNSNAWAASARGWLYRDGAAVGNYLDYGPDHYRSPHEYCQPDRCNCRDSQPGNVHCVVNRPEGFIFASRYVETVEQAHQWIEEQTA